MWKQVVENERRFCILHGQATEVLRGIAAQSVQACVTSPPYWGLRDYGVDGQLGNESTPQEYVAKMVALFGEVKRVLRDDGVLWLNLGDSYTSDVKSCGRNDTSKMYGIDSQQLSRKKAVRVAHGLKPKELVGIPWRVAFALQDDGWFLRCDIVWAKPNPMPESVTDRPTRAHEYIFMLTKKERYFYDIEAGKVPTRNGKVPTRNGKVPTRGMSTGGARGAHGKSPDRDGGFVSKDGMRNQRTIWSVKAQPCHAAHFAVFPWEIPKRCITASTKRNDIVLDPFSGSGTTGAVALANDRRYIGIDLNAEYIEIAEARIAATMKAVAEQMRSA